jgi:hypothetical protein
MANSEVEICNMALAMLGANQIMVKEVSQPCNIHYDTIRDAILEDVDWSFALKRITLKSPSTATPSFGWNKQFLLPTDCIRVIDINNSSNEWVKEGRFILTNHETIDLSYVSRVVDVRLYPGSFTNALAARLASVIAVPLTNSVKTAQGYWSLYLNLINDAKQNDGRQGPRIQMKRRVILRRNRM